MNAGQAVFAPTSHIDQELTPNRSFDTLRRIVRMTFAYPWRLGFAIVCAIGAAVFQLAIPRLLGDAVDDAYSLLAGVSATPDEIRGALVHAALLIFFAGVVRGILTMLFTYHSEAIGQHIGYGLRLQFYKQLQRLSFSYHDKIHTGELITRGMLDVEGVRMFVDQAVVRIFFLATLVVAGCVFLMTTDPLLGLLSLSFVPFVAWNATVGRLRLRQVWLALQEKLGVLTRIMEENLGGIRVVRAFGAEKFEMRAFDDAAAEALDLAKTRVQLRFRLTSLMTFEYLVAMALVLWVGGIKVSNGEITVGTLAEFLAFMTILQLPVRQLGMVVNAFARASMSGRRLFEILDETDVIPEKDDATELEPSNPRTLKFDNVQFAYDPKATKIAVLRGISFEISAGQTLGIVGPPGSGKSTIAHLIPRFYDVSSGTITVDGIDIRDCTLESLRRVVSVVQQDAFLFTASIENNVAYGDPWAERDRISQAAESARLHDYITQLPQGYESLVGERGISLSGGQRQRLSISRSTLLLPSILVLDDATSAIDAVTEKQIRASLIEFSKTCATIIISHRLSSLMHADEILFLEDGMVAERGTHDELLALGGRYKALHDLQGIGGQTNGD